MSLNRRVTLERPVSATDAEGEPSPTWVPVTDVWAGVRPVSASERIQAGQVELDVSHVVRIRHRGDITPRWRVKLGDRVLDIRSLLNVREERRYLQLLCLERERTA